MADCVITPYVASALASKDSNRIQGQISKALALNSPFVNILDGGVLPAGVSDTVRSVIQEQALAGDSLVAPAFVATKDLCGPIDSSETTATTEYTYSLGTKRARGPKICVKGAYAAYKGSYLMAEDSLKKLITQYFNADVRSLLLNRSGVKYVALDGGTNSFSDGLTGSEFAIDTLFANVTAANIGKLNFNALHKLARYAHEVLLVEMFEDGTNSAHYKFIGGSDIIEAFRNELNVVTDLRYLSAGGFRTGADALFGYRWEGPYRGITFGLDQRPLRAATLVAGQPVFIEPFVGVVTTNGTASRVNPAWVQAAYEVGFLIGKSSFERLVPERYTGEGTFKFSPQLAMGELQWHYQIDNDCNQFGDFGWHKYEITRAYRPVRPHSVIPILYRRCNFETGIVVCSTTGSLL